MLCGQNKNCAAVYFSARHSIKALTEFTKETTWGRNKNLLTVPRNKLLGKKLFRRHQAVESYDEEEAAYLKTVSPSE